jgi:hypothetical protein
MIQSQRPVVVEPAFLLATNNIGRKTPQRIVSRRYYYNENNNNNIPLFTTDSVLSTKRTTSDNGSDGRSYELLQHNDQQKQQQYQVTLQPLSLEPMILVSSGPLLNATECIHLKEFFQQISSVSKTSSDKNVDEIINHNPYGYQLFQRVQNQIDELTMCQHHNGEPQFPRLISYQPSNEKTTTTPVIADGVHVDTNNGQLFRHMTIILYLTTNTNGGATTFPLAKSVESQSLLGTQLVQQHSKLMDAAQCLLDNNVHHSHCVSIHKNTQLQQCGKLLEDAATELFDRQQQQQQQQRNEEGNDDSIPYGIRVTPQAGYICVMSNIRSDGRPDPASFHAGETVYVENGNNSNNPHATRTKDAITFFKEIPLTSFRNQKEFGQQVSTVRQRLFNRYYSNHHHLNKKQSFESSTTQEAREMVQSR